MRKSLTSILVLAAVLAGCGEDTVVAVTVTTAAPTSTATESTMEAGVVTGETYCVEGPGEWSGPALEAAGLPGTSLNMVYDCEYAMSDQRVNGTGQVVVNLDFSVNGDATVGEVTGTSVISNEGGVWVGTLSGTTTWSTADPIHVHVIDGHYLGTGDYAGLRFDMTNAGTDFPWTTTGRIDATG
jgi:hypothetical protein